MKKAEYYLNVKLADGVKEYPKVCGYIEDVIDSKGNALTIGYDKREGQWHATIISTGMHCSLAILTTRKDCIKETHEDIDRKMAIHNRCINDKRYYKKYIKPFRDFVDRVSG